MCPSGTNINGAVLMAVELLDRAIREETVPSGSVSLIILLTDGDPTVGKGTASHDWAHCTEGAWGSSLACCGTWGREGAFPETPLALRF